MTSIDGILREHEVRAVTGLSRTTRWRLERAGAFPARIQLSTNAIGWRASDIQNWIDNCIHGHAGSPEGGVK